jgi:hypothetical protein
VYRHSQSHLSTPSSFCHTSCPVTFAEMDSTLPPPPAAPPALVKSQKQRYVQTDAAEPASVKYQKADAVPGILDPVNFQIQGERYISVAKYRDETYVKIRDYTPHPTTQVLHFSKRGINMSVLQWRRLQELIPHINDAIAKSVI